MSWLRWKWAWVCWWFSGPNPLQHRNAEYHKLYLHWIDSEPQRRDFEEEQ